MTTPGDQANNRLRDVMDACDELAPFLRDKTLEDYLSDNGLRRITERMLTIIGESVGQAIKHNPDLVNRIPNARAIVGMRNWLIHAYPDIDHPTVWDAATSDVPTLTATIRTLLAEEPNQ